MKRLLFSILVLFVIVFTPSCVKEGDEYIPQTTVTITRPDTVWEDESAAPIMLPTGEIVSLSISKLYNNLQNTITKGEITAESGGTITLNQEAFVDFPANCLVFANTNQPCKGKVDIDFVVLKNRGDLISFDKSTISNGRLLASGGSVFISAKQGLREVKLAQNKTVRVRFKSDKIDRSLQLFEGKTTNTFKFNRLPLTTSGTLNMVNLWLDSLQTREPKGYDFLCDRFGWISCDRFVDESNITNKILVSFSESQYSNKNTSVYLVFNDNMSVIKLEGNVLLRQFTIPSDCKGVAIGKEVKVVSITQIGDKSFLDIQETKIAQTNIIRMKPQAGLSLDEIRKKLSSL